MSSLNKGKKALKKSKKSFNALLIFLVCAVIVAAVAFVTIVIIAENSKDEVVKAPFVPPEFESEAIEGTPDITDPKSENYRVDYQKIYREGMTFSAFLCGEVIISDGKADIYFTNPEESKLLMKLRIFDENGNVIAETGLIKPNEHLKTVRFDVLPENGSKISMKIMTYEPETYYSGGAATMTTVAIVK